MPWLIANAQWPQRVTMREEKARAKPMRRPQGRIVRRCWFAWLNAGRISGLPGLEIAKAKTPLR